MNDGTQADRSVVYSLLDCLEIRTILRCAIDAPPEKEGVVQSLGRALVDACDVELLGPSLENARQPYDALWLVGHVSWHGLHAVREPLLHALDVRQHEAGRPLIVFVEGPPPEGPSAWAPPETLAAQFSRANSTKEGIRFALESILEGRGYVVLWFSTGAGAGLAVPETLWLELGPLASIVEALAKGLSDEQRRATAALALAYESQAEITGVQGASAPATQAGDALVAQYLATADTSGASPRLVCDEDGKWFLVEGQVRRYIPSGIIVWALEQAIGAPVSMASDELATYERVDSLSVISCPDSNQLIVGGKRIRLRGFPTVFVASKSAVAGIEVSQNVDLNGLRFIAPNPAPRGGARTEPPSGEAQPALQLAPQPWWETGPIPEPELSVVVLTWNNLPLTRRFVASVRSHTKTPYELIIVDNGSARDSVDYGQEAADVFIRNETNRGFAVGMNQGLAVARGTTVAFCNNDTLVPEGWDSLLLESCSRPNAGMVYPALTAATNQRTVRKQPGTEVEVLDPYSAPPAGAFVVMQTAVARAIGGWGEEYPIASGEDIDLAFKLWVNDLDLLFDSRVLIEHVNKASSRNLPNWQALWKANRGIFLDKWISSPSVPRLPACPPARHARNLAAATSAATWMHHYFRGQDRDTTSQAAPVTPSAAPSAGASGRDSPSSVRQRLRALWVSHSPPQDEAALRIRYIVPGLGVSGGVFGVTQLVNELRLLGVDAGIVSQKTTPQIFKWRLLHPPTIYRDFLHLKAELPETDILVATHFLTAQHVHDLVASGRARAAAYFLQDYEAWFFPEHDVRNREIVRSTYHLIQHKIVKSDWLASLLAEDGHATHKIPIGLDHGFFYPRPVPKADPPVVFAMARPATPRRGFDTLVRTFELVHTKRRDAELVVFGQRIDTSKLPFPCRCEGLLTDQERLATIYSGATVHVDTSDFQAFGRPALEAMACGVASVLTDVGGVSSYARNEENCLLVPPREPEQTADAILRLLGDAELRQRLIAEGLRTVNQYSMHREARDTLALFRRILAEAEAQPQPEPSHHDGPTPEQEEPHARRNS